MDETPALCFVRGQVPEIWKKDGMPRLRMNQEKVTVLLKTDSDWIFYAAGPII
jgi:hypothetical protein